MEIGSIASLFIVYRYDSTTGTFTVPSGGDGFYYFSVYLWVRPDRAAYFEIELNGELICTAASDVNDYEMTSCRVLLMLLKVSIKNRFVRGSKII